MGHRSLLFVRKKELLYGFKVLIGGSIKLQEWEEKQIILLIILLYIGMKQLLQRFCYFLFLSRNTNGLFLLIITCYVYIKNQILLILRSAWNVYEKESFKVWIFVLWLLPNNFWVILRTISSYQPDNMDLEYYWIYYSVWKLHVSKRRLSSLYGIFICILELDNCFFYPSHIYFVWYCKPPFIHGQGENSVKFSACELFFLRTGLSHLLFFLLL